MTACWCGRDDCPPATADPLTGHTPAPPEFIVAYLQQRRRDALRAIRACTDTRPDYWRWQGHAELSRQLLERLGAEVPQ